MSFKNALKNLVAHFGIVWSLLVYIVVFAAVITGLSLPFVVPIARAMTDAGVFTAALDAFKALFDTGWQAMVEGLYTMYNAAVGVFVENNGMVSLTMTFLVVVVVIAFRFFLGLYEIPITTVLDGQMSCNARYGFGGKFFSTLWVSIRYSFAKMLYTTVYDTALGAIVYGVSRIVGFNIALPFVMILIMLVLVSLRFSIASCWAPSVACDGYGVAKGFARAVTVCFKRFATIYSSYIVALLAIMAIGVFVTLFTVGVGLIIVIPLSVAFISYLNITVYYNKTGKRYYIDREVFSPPQEIKE